MTKFADAVNPFEGATNPFEADTAGEFADAVNPFEGAVNPFEQEGEAAPTMAESFGSGVDSTQAQFQQLGALIADQIGADQISSDLLKAAEANMAEAGKHHYEGQGDTGLDQFKNLNDPQWWKTTFAQTVPGSAPFLGGAAAGAGGGALLGGPVGALIGAALGGGGTAFAQELGGAYYEYLEARPGDTDGATEYAIKKAGLTGIINAASIPFGLAGRALGPVKHMLVQSLVQPGVGVTDTVAGNVARRDIDPEQDLSQGVAASAAGEFMFEGPATVAVASQAAGRETGRKILRDRGIDPDRDINLDDLFPGDDAGPQDGSGGGAAQAGTTESDFANDDFLPNEGQHGGSSTPNPNVTDDGVSFDPETGEVITRDEFEAHEQTQAVSAALDGGQEFDLTQPQQQAVEPPQDDLPPLSAYDGYIEDEPEEELQAGLFGQDADASTPSQPPESTDVNAPVSTTTDVPHGTPADDITEIDVQAHQAATSPANDLPDPTPAQIEAGNYKKGHIKVAGLDITVENPKGSVRSGTDPDGNEWSHEMQSHYGYIKRTEGADGEHVDVFVGDQHDSQLVYVIDQVDANGEFDEHKVMLGFPSEKAAIDAYKENYDEGWTVGPVSEMSSGVFAGWLKDADLTKPKSPGGLKVLKADREFQANQERLANEQAPATPPEDQLVYDDDPIEAIRANAAGESPEMARLIVARDVLNNWIDDFSAPAEIAPSIGELYRKLEKQVDSGKPSAELEVEIADNIDEWLKAADIEAPDAEMLRELRDGFRRANPAGNALAGKRPYVKGMTEAENLLRQHLNMRDQGIHPDGRPYLPQELEDLDATIARLEEDVAREKAPDVAQAEVEDGPPPPPSPREAAEAELDFVGETQEAQTFETHDGKTARIVPDRKDRTIRIRVGGKVVLESTDRDALVEKIMELKGLVESKAPASEAPEHAAVGVDQRELSEIVTEFNDAQASMQDGDWQVHHLFDAPTKSEIVRLANKVKVYNAEHGWMTPAEARARIEEWKEGARSQGGRGSENRDKVVLSFFDLTGKWSQPWEEAGYQVYRFDIQADPNMGDVNNFSVEFFSDWFGDFDGQDIYAILAACPCTDFAVSGARHFAAKDKDGRTVASVKLVHQTLAAIEYFRPAIWAIENPVGRIEKLGGLPPWRLSFDPNHLGETYTKKTLIWGRFNADLPIAPVEPVDGSKMHKQYGGKSLATKNARSATPEGFSYGFFQANNAVDHPAMAVSYKYDRLDSDLIEKALKAGVTPAEIDDAVADFYWQDLDDDAANDAIRALTEGSEPPQGTPAHEPEPEPQPDAAGVGQSEITPPEYEEHPALILSGSGTQDSASVELVRAGEGYAIVARSGYAGHASPPNKPYITASEAYLAGLQWIMDAAEKRLRDSDTEAKKKANRRIHRWAFDQSTLFEQQTAAAPAEAEAVDYADMDPAQKHDYLNQRLEEVAAGFDELGDPTKAKYVRARTKGRLPVENKETFLEQQQGELDAARGEPAEQAEKPKRTPRKKRPKKPPIIDRVENYFQPGRVVEGYAGSDRVIEFRNLGGGRWEVDVEAVDDDGNAVGPKRTHSTIPDERKLRAWERDNPLPTDEEPGAETEPTPAPEEAKAEKPRFTFKIKPFEDGYMIQSDDGGGMVMAGKPKGPALLDDTPARKFDSVDAARDYMRGKDMALSEDEDATPPAQQQANQLGGPKVIDGELVFPEDPAPEPKAAAEPEAEQPEKSWVQEREEKRKKEEERRRLQWNMDLPARPLFPTAAAERWAEAKVPEGWKNSDRDESVTIAGFKAGFILAVQGQATYEQHMAAITNYDGTPEHRTPGYKMGYEAGLEALENGEKPPRKPKGGDSATIPGQAAEESGNAQLDQAGERSPSGVPTEGVRGPEGGGDAGQDADAPGAADGPGSGPAGAERPDGGRSPAGDEGAVPVSGAGARSDSAPGSGGLEGQGPELDFTITSQEDIASGGDKTKFRNNIAAIRLLKELESQGRQANPEEQAALAKYVGWGGLPQAFFRESGATRKGWEAEAAELKELLTDDEYAAARRSTQDAHYTSTEVIEGMYAALDRLGFKHGRVLEPSLGAGNFFGMMPAAMREASDLTGVELDHITGGIAKQLYNSADIHAPVGFQDFSLSDGYFDLAIGNPPFGSQQIYDKHRPDISKFSIHNYFFGKSLAGLRPGGVLAMVVSNSFLDKVGKKQREYLATQAELLGAIRLPNNAFKANAGTEVTTDIIFMRKLEEGEVAADMDWVGTSRTTGADGVNMRLNNYFMQHPEMMLGEMRAAGSMYRADEPALIARDGQNTGELLKEAIQRLPEGIYREEVRDLAPVEDTLADMEAGEAVTHAPINGMFIREDGQLMTRLPDSNGNPVAVEQTARYNSKGEEVPLKDREIERLKGMVEIARTLSTLLQGQLTDATDAQLQEYRDRLNEQYDAFVKKNGYINARTNKGLFRDDPMWPRLAALEVKYDAGISAAVAKKNGQQPRKPSAQKADIFKTRTQMPYTPITRVGTAKEGLVVSLSQRGRLDLEHIQSMTGMDEAAVIEELKGLIYHDPVDGWVTAEEYLSGNVKRKLRLAKAAADEDAQFADNVTALEAVIPEDIPAVDISVKIGAPWIGPETMSQFVDHLAGEAVGAVFTYAAPVAKWSLESSRLAGSNRLRAEWSTSDKSALDLIMAAANNKIPTVTRKDADGNSYTDKEATDAAQAKLNEIKQEFEDWLWADADRREKLAAVYNDSYNTTVGREYDGSHLELPGQNQSISLRPHQSNFVWRVLQSQTTLADHVVGAGKTFALIAAAMELRRTGLSKKPMLVVPNHLVQQWANDFMLLYPNANILVPSKQDFALRRRRELFGRIATGDWDAVIVAHSSFKKLPSDPKEEEAFIRQQITDLETSVEALRASQGKGDRSTKELEKAKERMQNRLKEMADVKDQDDGLNFSELGVDSVFVDEAHEYKNLAYQTSMTRVAGLGNTGGSQKASDMFIKTQSVLNRKGRVVFATGTPVSNSIAEKYTIQRYLGYQSLREQGLAHFDAWANIFGEVVTDTELDATGVKYKMNSRFNKFVNLPELLRQYFQFADVIDRDDINAMLAEQGKKLPIPKIKGGGPQNIIVPRSPEIAAYMATIVERAESMSGKDPSEDNMLKVTNDARKAALDIRLIDPEADDNPDSKTNYAVEQIMRLYRQWEDVSGTQLVFLDLSTPKGAVAKERAALQELRQQAAAGDDAAATKLANMSPDDITALESAFSVYDDMRAKLIAEGIPDQEIAFIHDANTDERKAALFEKVNRGEIRVLLGSTAKMGAGMNVQERLVALHHMDAPWKPSDLEQREGRIIRQGNQLYERDPEGFEIEIFRYATEMTYDARMWQTIEGKARFIEQLRNGDLSVRVIEDIAGQSASAAEMKAEASGNPLIMEEFKLRSELKKLEGLKKQHDRKQFSVESDMRRAEREVDYLPGRIRNLERDVETVNNNPFPKNDKGEPVFTINLGGREYNERPKAGDALLLKAHQFMKSGKDVLDGVGTFMGLDIGLSRVNAQSFSIDLTGLETYSKTITDIDEASATGLMTRISNLAQEILPALGRAQSTLERAQRDVEELQGLVGAGFKQEDELKAVRARHAEVVRELSKTDEERAKDRELEQAPFDPETWYHGTADEITELKPRTFITQDRDYAAEYAYERAKERGTPESANVVPIQIKSSLAMDMRAGTEGEQLLKAFYRSKGDESRAEDTGVVHWEDAEEFAGFLKARGKAPRAIYVDEGHADANGLSIYILDPAVARIGAGVGSQQDATRSGETRRLMEGQRAAPVDSLAEPLSDYEAGQQDLPDPYERTETRPGTTEAQREVGRSGIREVFAALQRERRRPAGFGRTGVSLLGAGIYKNFQEGRPNQLIGSTIEGYEDLAMLAQVYRSPKIETLRVIWMNGTKVVGETAVTSRLPGAIDFGPGFLSYLQDQKKMFGANGYYLLHNHPSGNPMPSRPDENATRKIAQRMPGLRYHVVIDHNQYGVLDALGNPWVEFADGWKNEDFSSNPEVPHLALGARISSAHALASIAKKMEHSEGYGVIIGTNADSRAHLIMSVPLETMKNATTEMGNRIRVVAALRRITREAGVAGHLFLLIPDGDVSDYRDLNLKDIITDVLNVETGASLLKNDPEARAIRFAPRAVTHYLGEDDAGYMAEEGPEYGEAEPGRRRGAKEPGEKPKRKTRAERDAEWKERQERETSVRGRIMQAEAASDSEARERTRAQLLKDWGSDILSDQYKGFLGLIPREYLPDFSPEQVTALKTYVHDANAMDARRNHLMSENAALVDAWEKYAKDNPEGNRAMADLMYQSTLAGVDPSKPYKPLITEEEAENKIKVEQEKARMAPGDSKLGYFRNIKKIKNLLAQEANRKKVQPILEDRWGALGPEAQSIYQDARDAYKAQRALMFEALLARIERSEADEGPKGNLMDLLRLEFETQTVTEPYFPLQRFGDYWVAIFEDDILMDYQMFEKQSGQVRFIEQAQRRGLTVYSGRHSKINDFDGAANAKLATAIAGIAGDLHPDVAKSIQDDIWQTYLTMLPELSTRKKFIHRKKIPGYNEDALRTFAHNMFHGSHQLSKLEWRDILESHLDNARAQTRKVRDLKERNQATVLVDEMRDRHQWAMDPRNSPLATGLTALGFAWYLGASVASAAVNLSQTVQIGLPVLAAEFGWKAAPKELARATRDILISGADSLKGAERLAFNEFLESGVVDKTQAHDLAGVAEYGENYLSTSHKVMAVVSWLFHQAEKINREVTALAAYRLAKAKMGHDQAVDYAKDAIWTSHYNYSNANRPRFMQNDVAKVILLFKQYSLNTTYRMARDLNNSLRGKTQEMRRLARRRFFGIQAMTAILAGIPAMWAFKMVAGVVSIMFDWDEDEPFEPLVELRAFLTEWLGPAGADLIMTGAVDTYTPVSISGRVSLSDLWFRDINRDLDGTELYEHYMMELLGPVARIPYDGIRGMSRMLEGDVARGAELMAPNFIEYLLKAGRYSAEGVTNWRKDEIVPADELSVGDLAAQAFGFTPSTVNKQYAQNSAIMLYQQRITNRRAHLMAQYWLAMQVGDEEQKAATVKEMRDFSRKNPGKAITPDDVRASMRSRARASAKMKNGMPLDAGLEHLIEDLDFGE